MRHSRPSDTLSKLEQSLDREAMKLSRLLIQTDSQLVLAESCTGGMVAAALTRIPGISKHFCGSSVAYQSETKHQWLKISQAAIERYGTESIEMSQSLASVVLKNTKKGTVAAAITGDLGPTGNVGNIFMACQLRKPSSAKLTSCVNLLNLHPSAAKLGRNKKQRYALQLLASQHLIAMVRQLLTDTLR
ncbi:CinA family protein [bacterium]|nr:CinA family protein [bacterium]